MFYVGNKLEHISVRVATKVVGLHGLQKSTPSFPLLNLPSTGPRIPSCQTFCYLSMFSLSLVARSLAQGARHDRLPRLGAPGVVEAWCPEPRLPQSLGPRGSKSQRPIGLAARRSAGSSLAAGVGESLVSE